MKALLDSLGWEGTVGMEVLEEKGLMYEGRITQRGFAEIQEGLRWDQYERFGGIQWDKGKLYRFAKEVESYGYLPNCTHFYQYKSKHHFSVFVVVPPGGVECEIWWGVKKWRAEDFMAYHKEGGAFKIGCFMGKDVRAKLEELL